MTSSSFDPKQITLTSSPVAGLLTSLFADAQTVEDRSETDGRGVQPTSLPPDLPEYLTFYAREKHRYLEVSPDTGKLLYLLARATRARNIIEFGTSFGISTIYLASALRDNGGGQVIGTEFEKSKVARARENLRKAGLDDLVEIREGDALETLAADLPQEIDLVLLDGAKELYPRVLSLLEPRLRLGAIIVADNADWSPDYLAQIRSNDRGYLSVPFRGDVELSVKLTESAKR
jgi:predicted O-methyltransferase YrrM